MIISIFNQKGGVGKSTTAINLCASLSKSHKVLLIDIDAQANSTCGSGVKENNTMYDLLQKKIDATEAVVMSPYGYFVIPSDISLANAEITLSNAISRESILKKVVKPILNEFDYIIIDCPPSLGLLSLNALVASDYIVIPVSPAYFSVKGIKDLLATFKLVKENLNDSLEIMGVLITKYNSSTNLAKDRMTDLREAFGDKVFETVIRMDVQVEYSQENGEPLIDFNKKCRAYTDYNQFAKEVESYGK